MSSHIDSLQSSYLFGGNAPYVEELYEAYLENPTAVPDNWRAYFDQLQNLPAPDGQLATRDQAHSPIVSPSRCAQSSAAWRPQHKTSI